MVVSETVNQKWNTNARVRRSPAFEDNNSAAVPDAARIEVFPFETKSISRPNAEFPQAYHGMDMPIALVSVPSPDAKSAEESPL